MGVVYKALDVRLDRHVALKVTTHGFAEDEQMKTYFVREAKSSARLDHPNVVSLYDVGIHEGNPFLVMQFLDGVSLEKVIKEKQDLSLERKLGIVVQVCRALDYAHRHDVIHRDIKPANIMLLAEDQVKILDFGIARLMDMTTRSHSAIVGTLAYMSLEQLNGEKLDGRTDIYSAGVVAYELITWVSPFDAGTTAATMMRIMQGDLPPLRQFIAVRPDELDKCIRRAVAKNRDDRFRSAAEFASEINRIQQKLTQPGLTVTTPPPIDSSARSQSTSRAHRNDQTTTKLNQDKQKPSPEAQDTIHVTAEDQQRILPLDICIETLGGVATPVIARNTPIPVRITDIFSTAAENQTGVEVHLLIGNRPLARDNRTLGKFHLTGIPPAPRGVPQIEVAFDIDSNGVLNVSAKDKATGKDQTITITASSGMSKEEVERITMEANAHAAEDKSKREEIDTRNQLDSMVYTVKKLLTEYPEKISSDEKSNLEAALTDAKNALIGTDTTAMNSAREKLNIASHRLAADMYRTPNPFNKPSGFRDIFDQIFRKNK
jgi:serine/threonine protein kinase